MAKKIPLCTPKILPGDIQDEAARTAIAINPVNAPTARGLAIVTASTVVLSSISDDDGKEHTTVKPPSRLGVMTSKYWGSGGVRLTVSFMERTQIELANRIITHMNAWNSVAKANIQFVLVNSKGQVRISRGPGGYYSYLGTDILHIPSNQQTMNLERFTMNTPESEFVRVVRHETGHTLGFPHEHLRRDLVAKLDEQKTIRYFMQTQGWSEQEVRDQVLVPIDEASLLNPSPADALSIMCYQLPGSITKDGKDIIGGSDLDKWDIEYSQRVYPSIMPPPAPPNGGGKMKKIITITGDNISVAVEDQKATIGTK